METASMTGEDVRAALRNLLLTDTFAFGTLGIADPGVFGEPLVHHMAERTVSPAEEYRGGAKGRRIRRICRGRLPALSSGNKS